MSNQIYETQSGMYSLKVNEIVQGKYLKFSTSDVEDSAIDIRMDKNQVAILISVLENWLKGD